MKLSQRWIILSSGTQISEYGTPKHVGKVVCRYCIFVPEGKIVSSVLQKIKLSKNAKIITSSTASPASVLILKKIKYFH